MQFSNKNNASGIGANGNSSALKNMDKTQVVIISITFLSFIIAIFYAFYFTPSYQATVLLESRVLGSLNSLSSYAVGPLASIASTSSDVNPVSSGKFDAQSPYLLNQNIYGVKGDVAMTTGNWLREMALIETPETIQYAINLLSLDLQNKPFVVPLFTPFLHSVVNVFGKKMTPLAKPKGVVIDEAHISSVLNGRKLIINQLPGTNNQYQLTLPDGKKLMGTLGVQLLFNYKRTSNSITISKLKNKKVTLVKFKNANLVQTIRQNMSVNSLDKNGYSNVIVISYENKNPKTAKRIANAMANATVILSKKNEKKYALESRKNLMNQKKYISIRLKKEEDIVGNFLKSSNSINPNYEATSLIDQLAEINKEIRDAESQKILLYSTSTPNNFHVKDIDSMIAQLKEHKQKVIGTMIKINAFDQQYSDVIRNYQTDVGLYQILSEQIERLNTIIANPVGDIRVISYAVTPDENISYSRILIIIIGIISGLVIGYIVALAIE